MGFQDDTGPTKAQRAAEEARKTRAAIEKPLPPDPEEMNEMRAQLAGVGLHAFAVEAGLTLSGDAEECALGDLLTDLMHWCDRQIDQPYFNFEDTLDRARENYAEETSK